MSNRPPCVAWAEKLALRYEDLSPADQADLDAHIATCSACQAAQADYHFLDARLRALPPPAIKPFPRLSFPSPVKQEGSARHTPSSGRFSGARQHAAALRPFRAAAGKTLSSILIACLILTLLLLFGGRVFNSS
ncbi:MAG TPA: zf-HC2 domain-containing protein, partial [Ktedonobacterales bacterium]